jgi:protein-S-isoprenylcysteine O-methyltransferase Ste14
MSTYSLAIALLVAEFISIRCFMPPNPTPAQSTVHDRVFFVAGDTGINIRLFVCILLWLYHTIVALTYPSPLYLLCPQPASLNPNLFQWSTYTTISLILIFTAGPLRLLAFRELGSNFTFRLAKPTKLITTGIYKYIQHPSYTGNIIVISTNLLLLARLDGISGCWLPESIARSQALRYVELGVLVLAVVWVVSVRVKDEEDMLRQTFGKEWEDYHARTKRFIPGVF